MSNSLNQPTQWRCLGCRVLNHDDFDICGRCGRRRKTAKDHSDVESVAAVVRAIESPYENQTCAECGYPIDNQGLCVINVTREAKGVARMRTNNERFETNERAVHIYKETENDWSVWLNTTVSDFDGLCVGSGVSRAQAISDTVTTLELIVARLRKLNKEVAL
jgi:hypothetical protein